jgi:hypothetical protein
MLLHKLLVLGTAFAMLLPELATANTSICDAVAGNLITNCGFETGDFTGWIHAGNIANTFVEPTFDGFVANSGVFFATLGPTGSDGTLSQTLTTTPGTEYAVTWYLGSDGQTPNDFTATWGTTQLFTQTDIPSTNSTYTEFTRSVVASAATTTLTFSFRNDPDFLALDDVSVTAAATTVPEPGLYLLLGAGIVGLVEIKRRRNR